MASPICEFGVEAPAVRPMRTGPSGSQPISSTSSRESKHVGEGGLDPLARLARHARVPPEDDHVVVLRGQEPLGTGQGELIEVPAARPSAASLPP